jgi:hypothetical protein
MSPITTATTTGQRLAVIGPLLELGFDLGLHQLLDPGDKLLVAAAIERFHGPCGLGGEGGFEIVLEGVALDEREEMLLSRGEERYRIADWMTECLQLAERAARTPARGPRVNHVGQLGTGHGTLTGSSSTPTTEYSAHPPETSATAATFVCAEISPKSTRLLSDTSGEQIAGRFSMVRTGPFSQDPQRAGAGDDDIGPADGDHRRTSTPSGTSTT